MSSLERDNVIIVICYFVNIFFSSDAQKRNQQMCFRTVFNTEGQTNNNDILPAITYETWFLIFPKSHRI